MEPESCRRDLVITAFERMLSLVASCYLFALPAARGMDLHLRDWHVADGLPDATITTLAQTPDGCLWVGTRKGLVRFDGRKFKPVGGLQGWITGLEADAKGEVWASTRKGEVWRVGRAWNGSLVHAGDKAEADFEDELPDENGLWIAKDLLSSDRAGVVWYREPGGAYLGFQADGQMLRPDVKGSTFLGWARDGEGRLHAIHPGGAVAVSAADPGRESGAAGEGGSWIEDLGGSESGREVVKRTLANEGISNRQLGPLGDSLNSHAAISASLVDRDGRIWVARWWRGIEVMNGAGGWSTPPGVERFPRCVVTCLFEDSQGSVWAGTLGEGLYRMRRQPVDSLVVAKGNRETIVTSVSSGPGGKLWVGTEGDGLLEWSGDGTRRHEEVGPKVTSTLADRAGRVWAATPDALVVRNGDRFEPAAQGLVLALLEDRAGNVWAGTQNGLVRFGSDGSKTEISSDAPRFLDIRCLAESPEGGIWAAGFASGIWIVTKDRLEPAPLPSSFRQKDIRSICFGAGGCLWIGTLYNGLFRWKDGVLQHLGSKDGLPDDCIIGIHREERGVLWFSSNNGIFGCPEASIRNYEPGGEAPLAFWQAGLDDGLENRGCSGGGQPVISTSGDGRLHVANMTAVASFLPRQIGDLQASRQVSIEAVKADGVELPAPEGELEVKSGVRRFEFEMLAPDLSGVGHQRVSYRLENLDREWLPAGRDMTAVYSRLAPGNYTLRVRAAGMDGNWHEAVRPLTLRVKPAVHETLWFRILTGLVLATLAVFAVSSRYRRKWRAKLERMNLLQAVASERARISRDMHDDLGARLTEILLIGERGAARAEGTPAGPPLEKIVVKARNAVRSLEEIVWSANPRNDSLPRLVEYLCSTSEEICDSAGIRCWQEVPERVPPLPLPPDYRHHVFLAVREAFHNIAKHSGAGDAWLEIGVSDGMIGITVEDNGRGLAGGVATGGEDGLRNIMTRMELCGGKLETLPRDGGGVRLRMVIPLPTEARRTGALLSRGTRPDQK
jgi:signal transduction histidine kinase/ligand-binding sensor domain-containing protein